MAKKKVEQETPPELETEVRKPGGRTIGAWRKESLNYLGKGATDAEVTEHMMKLAKDNGYDYRTDDAETAQWRARVQAELDGTTPALPRTRTSRNAASTEPTLTDLMAVLSEMRNAELPDLDGLSCVEAWSALIDRVETLAAKVGGVSNLRKCLTTAASLMELTKGE